ncbi:MAG: CpaF family protein, partial [Hyphomicrobium sp.]
MFGRRSNEPTAPKRIAPQAAPSGAPQPAEMKAAAAPRQQAPAAAPPPRPEPVVEQQRKHSEEYYDVKTTVFNALIDTIDLTQLAKLDSSAAREEIRDIVSEIIQIKNVVMSIAEQEELLEDICN